MKDKKKETSESRKWQGSSKMLALDLLCLLLVFMVAGGLTFGAMRSTTAGSSSARVAAYAVSAESNSAQSLSLNCNSGGATTAAYQFAVKNQNGGKTSEVKVAYDIQVTLSSALPEGLTMEIDGSSPTVSADRKTFTFKSDSWAFAAGTAGEQAHTLTFTADAAVVTSNATVGGIQIKVNTEQVD